jgi:hypothetical protein
VAWSFSITSGALIPKQRSRAFAFAQSMLRARLFIACTSRQASAAKPQVWSRSKASDAMAWQRQVDHRPAPQKIRNCAFWFDGWIGHGGPDARSSFAPESNDETPDCSGVSSFFSWSGR